ncbi:MAG: prepilin-type N-terminal cleavage/methylation domain-containing protein [Candidatus Hydrogenedentes bacterium]|nr:prepilin-type N-terminal cleavage/methylation domain-containing protein [Candidatus Hydrogenedentota bacterium]
MSPKRNSGFTLAELLVASTLLAVVMGGVYVAFSSSIRLWRIGEANLRTYQDARTAVAIMQRELQSMAPNASHLFEGDDNSLEFYAVVPPMDVESGGEARLLWIRYRLKADPDQRGKALVREERIVEGAIPPPPDDQAATAAPPVKLGPRRTFELASGVVDLEFEYCWVPIVRRREHDDEEEGGDEDGASDAQFVIEDRLRAGDGVPQAVRLALMLDDPNADGEETAFRTAVTFRGPTTPLIVDEEDAL